MWMHLWRSLLMTDIITGNDVFGGLVRALDRLVSMATVQWLKKKTADVVKVPTVNPELSLHITSRSFMQEEPETKLLLSKLWILLVQCEALLSTHSFMPGLSYHAEKQCFNVSLNYTQRLPNSWSREESHWQSWMSVLWNIWTLKSDSQFLFLLLPAG